MTHDSSPAGRFTDFQCDTTLPADKASVRFAGPYQHQGHRRQVVWDLTLYTLRHFRRVHGNNTSAFIEITETGDKHCAITIALPVERIDLPVIRKTIIMVRQYKRLRPGRHEFGENIA